MTAALAACGIALTVAALTAGALRIRGRDVAATVARWRTAADRFLDRHMEPPGAHGRNSALIPAPPAAASAGQALAAVGDALDELGGLFPGRAAYLPAPAPGAVPGQAQAPANPRPEAARTPARQQLPQPSAVPPSASPGLGQHPFNAPVPPVYGHRDGQRVRRPIAIIRNGTVNSRQTGQLEALAAPVVDDWAANADTLRRLLDGLRAMEVTR